MLQAAYNAIDIANAADPKKEEVAYGQRMTVALLAFCPDASVNLKLSDRIMPGDTLYVRERSL